ncbi:related to GYP8-GTPase-activating protein [Sporisorium reilianum f. sp. reilianum]|uniref:Related to GYP8-GTPase-activating protein n=1 Tax=Sporisorium reilianum f. sp. reilianum TaxID=72559 RepID=A0A2N8UKI1_9BASI|nr:related to GYP8-GTPase-activating protein [Sporisorium reilianum f. sp. reilianum]
MTAESSIAAAAPSPTATAETSKSRRQKLQQQCLEPCPSRSTAFGDQHVEAWLFLLGITEEHIRAHISTLQSEAAQPKDEASSSSCSEIVNESESATIPLDKDGWQVATEDILRAGSTGTDGRKEERQDDEWKVVKSKKARRRKDDETASTVSAPNSPELDSKQGSSTPASGDSSPNPDVGADTVEHGGSKDQDASVKPPTPTSQQQYPNLSSRDIEQVAKDVERSFIGPAFKPLSTASKSHRRAQLSHLILTTLSRHPALSYFQGYHDILSILLLALSPSPSSPSPRDQAILELAASRLSLHVIRDSMTRDLLPVMGQLKLLSRLLHLADPPVAALVDRAAPLPFFALPWLLTLLTHDTIHVGVMQRAVEFVLAFGPGAAVYLCAAVLLLRRAEVMQEDEEDAAVLHAVLGRMPLVCVDWAEAEAESAMYTDPDVELPSLAADRARAAKGTPVSTLLEHTVALLHRFPLHALHADTLMGPASALFTWPALFDADPDTLDWSEAAARAEEALEGPTDRIVLDPHPPPDPDDPPTDADSEKHPKRNNAREAPHNARVLAVVGISGLLVAALFTASQSPAAVAGKAEETRRVLTLIVSLLSSWGRVVGGAR